MTELQIHPKRVLIIGGGPCGLVTLRNLLERGHFEDVQLVERRDNIGGVWYHPPKSSRNVSENANVADSTFPTVDCSTVPNPKSRSRPDWPSPAYPGLIGNVIPEFLSFSSFPFPEPLRLVAVAERPRPRPDVTSKQPFPTVRETYEYLEAFARPFFERGKVRLNHEVVGVEEVEVEVGDGAGGGGGGGWRVMMKDWTNSGGPETGEGVVLKEEMWDAVVITTAWFDNAYYPDVEGLSDLKWTGRVRHAKTWRGPDGYEGKRVVVIGNANSANEMAAQLAPVAELPVYRSTRRVSIFPSLPDDRIEDIGPVVRYTPSNDPDSDKITIHLKDRTIEDIDYVLFGTGYYPDVPYLRVRDPRTMSTTHSNSKPPSRSLLRLTDHSRIKPARIPSLYRHVLYTHNTSLAFIGALVSFIPFAMADLTSTWLALVWQSESSSLQVPGPSRPGPAGLQQQIQIPSTVEDRLVDEHERLRILHQLRSETENPSDLVSFHFLGRYELPYAKKVRAEIVEVVPELGDVLARWDDEQDVRRFAMYATKLDSLYALAGRRKPEVG